MPKPVAFVVHHGTTEFNERGLYTGFINEPLSPKGVNDADVAHQFLSRQSIERVVSSPLCRAVRTAEIIAPNLCIEQNNQLFPWSIPEYWGKPKAEFEEALEEYIRNPDKRPKNGETLNEFMERTGDFFEDQLNEHCVTLFVAHTTNLIALCDLLDGTQKHDTCISPGGIIAIYPDKDGWRYEILLGEEEPGE